MIATTQPTAYRWSPAVLLSMMAMTLLSMMGPSHAFPIPVQQQSRQHLHHNKLYMSSSSLMGPSSRDTVLGGGSTASTSGGKTFEERMRNLVARRRQRQTARRLEQNVQVVTSLEDYKRVVGGEQERIVCVRFSAPWCKACRSIDPQFGRLAQAFPNVLFVDVPLSGDSGARCLHRGLGVPSLPYGHIYTPSGGLAEELKLNKTVLQQEIGPKLRAYAETL